MNKEDTKETLLYIIQNKICTGICVRPYAGPWYLTEYCPLYYTTICINIGVIARKYPGNDMVQEAVKLYIKYWGQEDLFEVLL